MIWLGIETANAPLSIAVVKNGKLLAEITQNIKLTHSVGAMPTIEELLNKVGLTPSDLDAIAVSEGPGSYTGVRIGVTIAKTLAWTLKKPLVGVSSLQVMAANVNDKYSYICPIIDARRHHLYTAVYKGDDMSVTVPDSHLELTGLLNMLDALKEPVTFVGGDVDVFWNEIQQRLKERAVRAKFTQDLPRAAELIHLAQLKTISTLDETHTFIPKYQRIAEAEANWIKEQKSNG